MDALHAEQRRFETGGPETGQRWPNDDRLGQNRSAPGAVKADPAVSPESWVGWTPADEPTATRQMTPDEIRVDELMKFAERVNLIRDTAESNQVRQLIKGRIDVLRPDREGQPVPESSHDDRPEIRADEIEQLLGWLEGPLETTPSYVEVVKGLRHRLEALRPEQTSSEQVLDQMTGGRRDPGIRFPGLSYRQAAADGIAINGEHRHILHGEKLALGIELSQGSEPYLIPPYQVDQLMAIADGRPSWPDVQHDTVENEPEHDPRVEGLGQLLEKVTKAQSDINRVGAVEAALQLLRLDLKYGSVSLLSDVDRTLLGSDLSDVLRGFLRA